MLEKPVILCDSREQQPLNFDDCKEFGAIICKKLDTGDYSLQGLENYIAIERKKDCNELYSNFYSSKAKKRFFSKNGVAERLSKIKHRFIVIESTLDEVLDPKSYFVNYSGRSKNPKLPTILVRENLIRLMMEYHISVIFAGFSAKNIIKHLLLTAWKEFNVNNPS